MTTRIRQIALFALLVAMIAVGGSATAADAKSLSAALKSITRKELKYHAGTLSADAFEGREAGSRGGRAAGIYIVSQLEKYNFLTGGGANGSFFQPFSNGYRNILAVLPGSDPKLKKEFVLVSAHYDHVGYGNRQNSNGPIGYIHNGADDNASGVAVVLEIINAFAVMKERPRRSVLFVLWDAEEQGLLGSYHWVRNPTVSRKQVKLVLNMDMVGRLRKGVVETHGIRSGKGLRRFISEHNLESGLRFGFQWNLPEESDHYPFIKAGIPAVLLSTGKHNDYHRPSDDAHKLNVKGMLTICRLTFRLTFAAANADALPSFRRECLVESDRDKKRWYAPLPALPARLGISWNSGKNSKSDVIRVSALTVRSPAVTAGLKRGDVITHFAKIRVVNSAHFRQLVMSAVNPVPVTISRPGVVKPVMLTVNLAGQARRVGITWNSHGAEPGVVVLRRVLTGSPAYSAGLRVGDRIYALNGKSFETSNEFRDRLAAAKNDVKLAVERNGNVRVVKLRLSLDRSKRKSPAK